MPSYPPFVPNSGEFPLLAGAGYAQTSAPDRRYNCIAWAADENARWWWPADQYYWPEGVPRVPTVQAFVLAFRTRGYERCSSRALENGFRKVALYALPRAGILEVQHAARQMPSGRWTSKLGSNADIEHTLEGLEGPAYGNVVQLLRRAETITP